MFLFFLMISNFFYCFTKYYFFITCHFLSLLSIFNFFILKPFILISLLLLYIFYSLQNFFQNSSQLLLHFVICTPTIIYLLSFINPLLNALALVTNNNKNNNNETKNSNNKKNKNKL